MLAPARGAHPRFFDRFDHLTSRWDPFDGAYDVETDQVIDPSGPAFGAVVETHLDHRWPAHTHSWDELIWPVSGTITVTTGSQAIPVPVGAAVRVRAHEHHTAAAAEGAVVGFRWLPGADRGTEVRTRLLTLSPLIRDTLLYLNGTVMEPHHRERAGAFADDLLEIAIASGYRMPTIAMPREEPLRTLCDALVDDPADNSTLHQWASQLHVSARTLSRQFRSELGTTFARWRTDMRLALALGMLADAHSITETSHHLGYATTSTFTTAFRRRMGITPGAYADSIDHAPV